MFSETGQALPKGCAYGDPAIVMVIPLESVNNFLLDICSIPAKHMTKFAACSFFLEYPPPQFVIQSPCPSVTSTRHVAVITQTELIDSDAEQGRSCRHLGSAWLEHPCRRTWCGTTWLPCCSRLPCTQESRRTAPCSCPGRLQHSAPDSSTAETNCSRS